MLKDLSNVVVPVGHLVKTYDAQPEPSVEATSTGLLLAHLGYGGDDPDEAMSLCDEVYAQLGRTKENPPITQFVTSPRAVSDLFVPNVPVTRGIRGGVVWTARRDALTAVLEDSAARARLFSKFQELSPTPQWFIVDDEWTAGDGPLAHLRSLGLEVIRTEAGAPFLVEVRRSDGLTIAGFVGGPPHFGAANTSRQPLVRAPRLRRVLLAAMANGVSPSFYEELRSRKSLLLFFVIADRTPGMTQWPGDNGVWLPVFADLQSLHRTARDLGKRPQSYGVGGLPSRELFAWAQNKFGLALGVFPDGGPVRYLKMDVALSAAARQ